MDQIRAELEALAAERATFDERRDALIKRAHEAGMTWNEIADVLGMTPLGLRKARARMEQS
ncbi:hypothetical protein [Microbacterium resistens]